MNLSSLSYLISMGCLMILSVVLLIGCSPTNPSFSTKETNPEYEHTLTVFTAKPLIKDVTLTCSVIGMVRPWKSVQIRAESSGAIETLHFEKGDEVKKGDLLVEIDTNKAQAQYDQAKAQYEIANANYNKMKSLSRPQEIEIAETEFQKAQDQLKEARRNFERLKPLRESGDITQSQFDEAETRFFLAQRAVNAAENKLELAKIGAREEELAISKAQVDQMAAALQLTKEHLNDSTITAPLDGIIVEKLAEEGEFVNIGLTLTLIVDIQRVKVSCRIPEKDIGNIKKELPVLFTVDALPEQTFEGTLHYLSVHADNATHSFPVEVLVNNKDRSLLPGMTARLHFTTQFLKNAILIEPDMVWSRNNSTGVYVLREDRVFFQPIELGSSFEGLMIVEKGIEPQDSLVFSAPEGLSDGQKIEVGGEIEIQ